MPRASVLAQGLRDATPDRILAAKRIWKVAAIALAHRLYELDLLTDGGTARSASSSRSWGYRRTEPQGITASHPSCWPRSCGRSATTARRPL